MARIPLPVKNPALGCCLFSCFRPSFPRAHCLHLRACEKQANALGLEGQRCLYDIGPYDPLSVLIRFFAVMTACALPLRGFLIFPLFTHFLSFARFSHSATLDLVVQQTFMLVSQRPLHLHGFFPLLPVPRRFLFVILWLPALVPARRRRLLPPFHYRLLRLPPYPASLPCRRSYSEMSFALQQVISHFA